MREVRGRTLHWLAGKSQGFLTLAGLLSAIGCSRRADDCNYNLTCGNFDPPDSSTATGGQTSVPDACGGLCEAQHLNCDKALKQCVECSDTFVCSTSAKPVCNASNKCVQCRENTDCPTAKPRCDTLETCVQCLANADCTTAGKTRCDTLQTCVECLTNADCPDVSRSFCSDGTCKACSTDEQCSQFTATGTKVCKLAESGDAGTASGTCVQCTEAKASACGSNSCNPATNKCTSTAVNSVLKCGACVSDAECSDNPLMRCVPMTFGTKASPAGNYCLRLQSATCTAPYSVPLSSSSVSNPSVAAFCGINQQTTSCPAVTDFIAGAKNCLNNADCGLGMGDGICGIVGTLSGKCTIPCSLGVSCLNSAPGNNCSSAGYCQ